jgi:hypothetical protein
MRHVLGFILAIVLAAAVYIGGSWGFLRLHAITATATNGALIHSTNGMYAIGALAGVALLAGILIVVPGVSALAPVLPGLVLIAWTVLYMVNIHHAIQLVPFRGDEFGRGFKDLLASGALGAAGIVMIIPLFVPSRWRRPRRDRDDAEANGLLSDYGANTTIVQ